MNKKSWLIRFLRWTFGTDDSLGIPAPDFGMALDMGITAMCQLADRPPDEPYTGCVDTAQNGLKQIFEKGLIDGDDYCLGMANIDCYQLKEEALKCRK
jgi:hypothetical protein